jgi:hypothetical protein
MAVALSACASAPNPMETQYPSLYSDDGCPIASELAKVLAVPLPTGSSASDAHTYFECRGGGCWETAAHDKMTCEIEVGCSYSIQASLELSGGAVTGAAFQAVQVLH